MGPFGWPSLGSTRGVSVKLGFELAELPILMGYAGRKMRPGDGDSAFDEFDASDVTQKNFYGVEATRNAIRSGGEPSALLMATTLLFSRSNPSNPSETASGSEGRRFSPR